MSLPSPWRVEKATEPGIYRIVGNGPASGRTATLELAHVPPPIHANHLEDLDELSSGEDRWSPRCCPSYFVNGGHHGGSRPYYEVSCRVAGEQSGIDVSHFLVEVDDGRWIWGNVESDYKCGDGLAAWEYEIPASIHACRVSP